MNTASRSGVIFYRRGVRSVDSKGNKVNGVANLCKHQNLSQVMYDIENKINLAVFPGLQVEYSTIVQIYLLFCS